MTVYVFTGPTLSAEEGRRELDAVFRPPAAQGDVYRAAITRPTAIGIIDGYFERTPAVWHKEILWAMAHGVHVFGSASMGALRAAELNAFGMEGVGEIFAAFHRGELEDDDEVAVRHASEADGYARVSEAMVNMRATLRAAEAVGAIGAEARVFLERIAKETFYADRSYPAMLRQASEAGWPRADLEAFRAFLPGGRVDQKRLDALAMLRAMRAHLTERPGPKEVRYTFEHTDAFEYARRLSMQVGVEHGGDLLADDLREELGVLGALPSALLGASERALALEVARGLGREIGPDELRATEEDFRRERGLFQPRDFANWRREHRLADSDVSRFFHDESQARTVRALLESETARALPDHLRASGEMGRVAARLADKQRVLATHDVADVTLADARLTETELWRWYFEERLRSVVPPDLEAHARRAGFVDADALRRAVLREWFYLRRLPDPR
ncbi:hypothetical protein LVJ94_26635 [Pendulispora rubella]|uniref:TfuA-like core domain-containing protein n=1 Tax=Pendulispora rubella TaxID=2741070 RepID=A0ABZ2KP99_9BACT